MGLPKTFVEASLPTDEIDLMIEKAMIFGALGGYKKLETEDVRAIFELAKG
jgi:alcohol dehydrogenase YqhD (iron-dependent ADH family)